MIPQGSQNKAQTPYLVFCAFCHLLPHCFPITYPMKILPCAYSRILLVSRPLHVLIPLGCLLHKYPLAASLRPIHLSRSSSNAMFYRSPFYFISTRIQPHFQISEPFAYVSVRCHSCCLGGRAWLLVGRGRALEWAVQPFTLALSLAVGPHSQPLSNLRFGFPIYQKRGMIIVLVP